MNTEEEVLAFLTKNGIQINDTTKRIYSKKDLVKSQAFYDKVKAETVDADVQEYRITGTSRFENSDF